MDILPSYREYEQREFESRILDAISRAAKDGLWPFVAKTAVVELQYQIDYMVWYVIIDVRFEGCGLSFKTVLSWDAVIDYSCDWLRDLCAEVSQAFRNREAFSVDTNIHLGEN